MHKHQSGNVIFFILLAIVLVGAVTAALRSGGIESANIDREDLSIKVSQVRQNLAELDRAVNLVMQNGISETEISFAADDIPAAAVYGTYNDNPPAEIFNPKGGGALWRKTPSGINDGSHWEFYGTTHAPGVGSDRADLIAVLPNVTKPFCDQINRINQQPITIPPADDATCIHGGTPFTGILPDDAGPGPFDDPGDVMNPATFTVQPAGEACISCGAGVYHFYHVLLAR